MKIRFGDGKTVELEEEKRLPCGCLIREEKNSSARYGYIMCPHGYWLGTFDGKELVYAPIDPKIDIIDAIKQALANANQPA